MILTLFLLLNFEVLPNRTVTIEDLTMHSVIEDADCRSIREVKEGERGLKTDEEYPWCYVVQSEPIMVKKDGQWKPFIKRSWE
jgi:hypothetical protein